jgi:chromosome segregation ATPase
MIATLHAQMEAQEAASKRERENISSQSASVSSIVAAANASREQARAMADQRLAQVHAAEMSRTTAEAAVAALQLQTHELESRLRSVSVLAEERQQEISSLRSAITSAANEIGTRRQREERAMSEYEAMKAEVASVRQAHLQAEHRAADAEAWKAQARQLESSLVAVKQELANSKEQMTSSIHSAAQSASRVGEVQAVLTSLQTAKSAAEQQTKETAEALQQLQGTIASQQQDIARLQSDLQDRDRQLREGVSREDSVKSALASAQRKVANLENETAQQRDALASAVADVKSYANEITFLANLHETATIRAKESDQQIAELKATIDHLTIQFEQHRALMDDGSQQLADELTNLNKRFSEEKSNLETAIAGHVERIRTLDDQLQQCNTRLTEEQESRTATAHDNRELTTRLNDQINNYENLMVKHNRLQQDRTQQADVHRDLEERFQDETARAAGAEAKCHSLTSRVSSLSRSLEQLEEQLDESRSKHQQTMTKFEMVVRESADWRAKCILVENALLTEQAEVEARTSLVHAHEQEIDRLRNDNHAIRGDAQRFGEMNAHLTAQAEADRTEIRQVRANLQEFQQEHAKVMSQCESLQRQYVEELQAQQQLHAQDAELNQKCNQLQFSLNDSRKANAELEARLVTVQSQCNQLNAELETLRQTVSESAWEGSAPAGSSSLVEFIRSQKSVGLAKLKMMEQLVHDKDADLQQRSQQLQQLQAAIAESASRSKDLEELARDQRHNAQILVELQARIRASEENAAIRQREHESFAQESSLRVARLTQEVSKVNIEKTAALNAAKKSQLAAKATEQNFASLLSVLVNATSSLEGALAMTPDSGLASLLALLAGGARAAALSLHDASASNIDASFARIAAQGLQDTVTSEIRKAVPLDATFTSTSIGGDSDVSFRIPRVSREAGIFSPPTATPRRRMSAESVALSSITGTPNVLRSPIREGGAPQIATSVQEKLQSSLSQIGDAITKLVRHAQHAETAKSNATAMAKATDSLRERASNMQTGGSTSSVDSDPSWQRANSRLEEITREARLAEHDALASVAEAEARVRRALSTAEITSAYVVNDLVNLVTELSKDHAAELSNLQTHIEEQRDTIIQLQAELRRQTAAFEAEAAQAGSRSADAIATTVDALKANMVAEFQQKLSHEQERAEKAVSKLRALRQELLRMAHDADERIGEETARRAAAEETATKLSSDLAHAKQRVNLLQSRISELTEALKVTTSTLRMAEDKTHVLSATHGAQELEATRLRQIVDRALHHLATPGKSSMHGGDDAADPLNDSLASAARLNDVTQRLSAYVRSGRRNRRGSSVSSIGSASGDSSIDSGPRKTRVPKATPAKAT